MERLPAPACLALGSFGLPTLQQDGDAQDATRRCLRLEGAVKGFYGP